MSFRPQVVPRSQTMIKKNYLNCLSRFFQSDESSSCSLVNSFSFSFWKALNWFWYSCNLYKHKFAISFAENVRIELSNVWISDSLGDIIPIARSSIQNQQAKDIYSGIVLKWGKWIILQKLKTEVWHFFENFS